MQRSQDFTFLTLVQTRSGSEGVISAIKQKQYGTPSDKYKLARNPQLNPKVFIDKN